MRGMLTHGVYHLGQTGKISMLSASERTGESSSTFPKLKLTMAIATYKISPALDDRNRARLESKTYTRAYTDIPNRALPETYQAGLGAIFTALTG